jgi:hypothetical protein
MRTIIYIGFLSIADAINPDWQQGQFIAVYVAILVIACAMDITDFIRR